MPRTIKTPAEPAVVTQLMTYTATRQHFAAVCDHVRNNREVIIITRHGKPDVALIAADELESLRETAHLLRSPRNAARLMSALQRALRGTEEPQTAEALRQELGLGSEE